MKAFLSIALAAVIAIMVVAMFDFQITESGELPEVQVSGGDMPNAEVRGPEFNVETSKKEVEIPTDVNVETTKKEIEIPTDVEFELPEDRESKELVSN